MSKPTLMLAGNALSACCKKIIPDQSDELLLKKLQTLIPEYPVRLALVGEEWYRLGGVVDSQGKRLSSDVLEWVERSYIECGQNLQTLIEHSIELQLVATKRTGKTLYFVVQTDTRAEAFVLIEIDKTYEVTDRLLVDPTNPPEDLEDFIDPIQALRVDSIPFGHARYSYRRKIDVPVFMETINERHRTEHPVQRFMEDWNRSSAGQQYQLSDYWIIKPYLHTGRFGEPIINVELINIQKTALPDLETLTNKKGQTLGSMLNRFDRQAGYPFAWFFYMLTGDLVSTHSAEAVFRDLVNDCTYLPKRDEAVLRDWIASPYKV